MTESKELVTTEPTMQMTPVEDIKKFMAYFEQVKQHVLKADDFETVTTTNKKTGKTVTKPYIKRSGWRKIAFACNLSDRILSAIRTDRPDGSFVWHVIVEVSTQAGRTSSASGACDTRERGWAHIEHDCYATAHTRAKNRAISDLVAGGVLSAEEIEDTNIAEKLQQEYAEDTREPDEPPTSDIDAALLRENLDSGVLRVRTEGNKYIVKGKGWLDKWEEYNRVLKDLGFNYDRNAKQWERAE